VTIQGSRVDHIRNQVSLTFCSLSIIENFAMRNRDDRVVENGIIVQEQKGGDKCKEMSGFFNWHIDF